eukprot:gene20570-26676_t
MFASDVIVNRTGAREALLLLEYCPGGHLLERLNSRKGQPLPLTSIYRIFGQILLAIQTFHQSNPIITHRDLKLENILFGVDSNVRICDFGSCVSGYTYLRNSEERSNAEEIISKETTQMYRAPEMVDLYLRQVLTEKTDIWALGCIFYALCFLSHPFQDAGSLGILNGLTHIPNNPDIPDDARTFITRMLDIDPEARPSISELFQSLSAIATGHSIPPHQLSQEAIDRRNERAAAAIRRQQKAQKKVVEPLYQPRQTNAVVDGNSVAAKRLAAKKGVQPSNGLANDNLTITSTTNDITNNLFNDFSPDFNVDFSKFESNDHVNSNQTNTSTNNHFDIFSNETPIETSFHDFNLTDDSTNHSHSTNFASNPTVNLLDVFTVTPKDIKTTSKPDLITTKNPAYTNSNPTSFLNHFIPTSAVSTNSNTSNILDLLDDNKSKSNNTTKKYDDLLKIFDTTTSLSPVTSKTTRAPPVNPFATTNKANSNIYSKPKDPFDNLNIIPK